MGKKELIKGILLKAYSVPFYLIFRYMPEVVFRIMYPNINCKETWFGQCRIGPRITVKYRILNDGSAVESYSVLQRIGLFIYRNAALFNNVYYQWFFGSMQIS